MSGRPSGSVPQAPGVLPALSAAQGEVKAAAQLPVPLAAGLCWLGRGRPSMAPRAVQRAGAVYSHSAVRRGSTALSARPGASLR